MRRRRAVAARAPVVALLAASVALAPATWAIAEGAAIAPNSMEATPPADAPAALGDPLESAECRRALATLNAEEAAVAGSAHAGGGVSANDRRLIDARLAPARRQAARACLARRADPATLSIGRLVRPTPVATPPLTVGPASSPAPMAATARAAPLVPPPPSPADKPYAITACDAGGCWANDGSRLNRVGPTLWGPRGICTVQGSLLQCP